jgi:hypothetical protein
MVAGAIPLFTVVSLVPSLPHMVPLGTQTSLCTTYSFHASADRPEGHTLIILGFSTAISLRLRDVTTKLSLGGNNDVIYKLFLPRGSLVSDFPTGEGKLVNLFLRCKLGHGRKSV